MMSSNNNVDVNNQARKEPKLTLKEGIAMLIFVIVVTYLKHMIMMG